MTFCFVNDKQTDLYEQTWIARNNERDMCWKVEEWNVMQTIMDFRIKNITESSQNANSWWVP